jgi:hypothetical protein
MFNPQEVIEITKAAIVEPDAAWAKAKAANRTAGQMAKTLTIPLVLACVAIGFVLQVVFYSHGPAVSHLLQQAVLTVILDIILVFAVAFLADFLAEFFGGTRNYNAAFNAAALTAVPSTVAVAVLPVPIVGWMVSLGLGVYGLYLLYRALPVFLTIPAEKRMIHFICTLLAAILAGYILGRVIAA